MGGEQAEIGQEQTDKIRGGCDGEMMRGWEIVVKMW